jgi:hypothetical protein
MRFLAIVALSLFVGSSLAPAQHRVTAAERDDLVGPVASVSVKQTYSGLQWVQPDGPTLVEPVWCKECKYDREGNHTSWGQTVNGVFSGEINHIVYDESGHAAEFFIENASTGQLSVREVVGPWGITERTTYLNGAVDQRQTYSYDESGRTVDMTTFDGKGKQIARVHTEHDADGNFKEKRCIGADGKIAYLQTYDAEKKEEHYLSFNQSGSVDFSWTVIDKKLTSFFTVPGSRSLEVANFNEHPSSDTVENYACRNNGKCELSRVHYEYPDSDERNQLSVEWRDAEGTLRYAAYYQYELDAFRNWTDRQIWVWSPELGERKLLEADSRTIAYWQK